MAHSNLLLLDKLHQLICYNVIGDLQYQNRYVGFNGELSFMEWYSEHRPHHNIFDGGYFMPTVEGNSCYQDSIYFTVSSESFEDYLPIYKHLSYLQLKRYFFIQYDDTIAPENWEQIDLLGTGISLPVPVFKVWEFLTDTASFKEGSINDLLSNYEKIEQYKPVNRVPHELGKRWIAKLEKFDHKLITQLYVQRLIFDGLLGFKVKRGIPSDIDCIVMNEKGKLVFVEVKEKDPSKRGTPGFGMDVHRIESLAHLASATKLNVAYVVRRVKDQVTREFVEWRSISILDFIDKLDENPIEGGTGMRSVHSSNPTYICDLAHFTILR